MSEGASVLMSSWPLLIGLGGLSGFLAGLLGIGGGAVIVPALVFALPMLGVDGEALPKIAIATSVAIMIPTAIASAQHHGARGFIDGHSLVLFAPSLILGSFAAGCFAHWINTQLICLLFVLYMLHIARGLARRTTARNVQPGRRPGLISFTCVGVLGGGLSALLGQGSASYAVPFMARFTDLRIAIGTAAALNIPLAAAGVLGYVISAAPSACGTACFGYVHLPAVAAIGISAVLAAPAGALLTQARYNFECVLGSKLAGALSAFRSTAGSIPRANNPRAVSRRFRASASDTSGWEPSARSFSFPLKRYLTRDRRDTTPFEVRPDQLISRKRPFSSDSLYGFSRGLALLMARSVSVIGGRFQNMGFATPFSTPIKAWLQADIGGLRCAGNVTQTAGNTTISEVCRTASNISG
jgi:uncharacterized membrane protein YfcA